MICIGTIGRNSATPTSFMTVEYLKSNKADILVLDMIMRSGSDGAESYKRVLRLDPYQKVIIVSGFSETDRVKEAQ
jgi:two-component system cell cycle sensor histidine kinase/response regulator CckA